MHHQHGSRMTPQGGKFSIKTLYGASIRAGLKDLVEQRAYLRIAEGAEVVVIVVKRIFRLHAGAKTVRAAMNCVKEKRFSICFSTMMRVIKNPEMTKKISTPMKPP